MGDESLFQASARRLSGQGFAAPLIVTAEDFRFIVTEQLTAVQVAPPESADRPRAAAGQLEVPFDPAPRGRQVWAAPRGRQVWAA